MLADDEYRLSRFPWEGSWDAPIRVLDVGVHVGAFAVCLAARYPNATFTCFEPAPEALSYLERNVATNGFADRIASDRAALGAQPGTARLLRSVAGSCESTLVPALAPGDAESLEVAVVDLAAAIGESRPPDLVKLDCEGGEYGIVLESDPALWASVRCILLEYHPVPGHSWAELEHHLHALGFRTAWHDPSRLPGLGMAMLQR